MKNRKWPMLIIAVVSIAAACCLFAACGDGDKGETAKTYTVSFDTDGAESIDSIVVKSGESVAQPPAPQKDGWVFKGWLLGEAEYDFSQPVMRDFTLKAAWNELYTVTFMSDGAAFKTRTAENGTAVSFGEIPIKADNIFMYWSESDAADGAQYDMSAPVTDNLTLYAVWLGETRANEMLSRALDGDMFASYPYTAKFTVSEVDGDETLSYTFTYRYFDNAEGGYDVYSQERSDWNNSERYTVFGSDGRQLCRYYKGKDAAEWQISSAVSSYEYAMPFKFGEMRPYLTNGDFTCEDGALVEDGAYVFHVYEESVAAFEMYVIGTYGTLFQNARVLIKDDRLVKVSGRMQGGIDFTIEFDYTRFEQSRPALPDSEVSIRKVKDGSGVVGMAVAVSDLTSLFELKVNGSSVAVTADMLDLGGLDVDNPTEGVYTIRLSYTAWDGAQDFCEATFTVAAQTLGNALGNKDYANASFAVGGNTLKRSGDVFFHEDSLWGYYFKTDDSAQGYKTAKMSKTTKSVTLNAWVRCVRIDVLLDLSADLFVYDDAASTYTLTPDYAPNKPYKKALQQFFAFTNTTNVLYSLVKLDDSAKPYSLILTVDGDKTITNISVSYYTTKKFDFEFAVTPEIEAATIPHEVLNAFTQYTVTYKSGDKADGDNKEVGQGGGSYTVLRYSDASFSWTVQSGWKFKNWKIEGEDVEVAGGAAYKLDDMENPRVTFVAQWVEMDKFTVTYKAGDGTGADVTESGVFEGAYTLKNIDVLSMTAQDGYVFVGWVVEGETQVRAAGASYNLAADVVFVAMWKAEFVSGVVYKQDETGKSETKLYDGSRYMVVEEVEVDLTSKQIKLTYTVSGATETAVLDLKEDKYYGKDYEITPDNALKNYFGEGVFVKFSADNSSLQISQYDSFDERVVDMGSAFLKQV